MEIPVSGSISLYSNQRKYNSKELQTDADLQWYDYGARMYDPQIGRFHTPDRFSEKYLNQSLYQYGLNNPLKFIDINGDSAWAITNKWNDDYIKKFNAFVGERAAKYGLDGKRFTCEDLALSLAIDFASENNLPFQFTNGEGTFDAASDQYIDFGIFKNDVLLYSGAPDLQNDLNTISVALGDVNAGTFILNRNSDNTATHVQMVSSVRENQFGNGIKSINIIQGNSGALNSSASKPFNATMKFLGAGNPANPQSWLYAGKTLERGVYFPQANYYTNFTTGSKYTNFSTERNVDFRVFNFKGMNINGAGGSW